MRITPRVCTSVLSLYTVVYVVINLRCAYAQRGLYRIAGNFRGVLIFVIFVTIPRVTKFSTHEFFHPRIFSRLLTSFAYRASGVTKFKTTKINSEDPRQLFTKICTPENYPLYGSSCCVCMCVCMCVCVYVCVYVCVCDHS